MKPSKNHVYCTDARKAKMLFEPEKKANNFIKFVSSRRSIKQMYSILNPAA